MLCGCFDLEYIFRTRRVPGDRGVWFDGECEHRLSRIFSGQELSGRMCSTRYFPISSRNVLPRLPANVGCHRGCHRHFTPLFKRVQNSALTCCSCSVLGWRYIYYQKEIAYFPGAYSIVDTILLRRIVQRIEPQSESRIIHAVRRLNLHRSNSHMGFRAI